MRLPKESFPSYRWKKWKIRKIRKFQILFCWQHCISTLLSVIHQCLITWKIMEIFNGSFSIWAERYKIKKSFTIYLYNIRNYSIIRNYLLFINCVIYIYRVYSPFILKILSNGESYINASGITA